MVLTSHTAAYDAKTRSELAEELPLAWESVAPIFGKVAAAAKPVAVEILGREHKETKKALGTYLEPHEADVNAWLLSKRKITEGQTWRDMPLAMMAQVEQRPEDFLRAVAAAA